MAGLGGGSVAAAPAGQNVGYRSIECWRDSDARAATGGSRVCSCRESNQWGGQAGGHGAEMGGRTQKKISARAAAGHKTENTKRQKLDIEVPVPHTIAHRS